MAKEIVTSLELELLEYSTRHNLKRLDELLADDFFECGKYGDRFGKKECLRELPQESRDKKIEVDKMEVHLLTDSLAQVRYLCVAKISGKSPTKSFRTSLWRKTDSGWQMFFHQGTLLAENHDLRLEFPNTSHKQAYLEMMEEWKKSEETPTSPRRLFAGNTYEEFLEKITQDLTANERGVNATFFFLMQDAKILGTIQIRHHIDHPDLIEAGGHIGYGIRPLERSKGYAKKMLSLALVEAQKLGLKKVLLTCDEDNISSAKVIEANGGVFERYSEKDGIKKRRYWIHIS